MNFRINDVDRVKHKVCFVFQMWEYQLGRVCGTGLALAPHIVGYEGHVALQNYKLFKSKFCPDRM